MDRFSRFRSLKIIHEKYHLRSALRNALKAERHRRLTDANIYTVPKKCIAPNKMKK